MTRTKSIPTHHRTCIEWPCSRTIPADSEEMRCPLHKAQHAAKVAGWALTETRQRRTFIEDDIAATSYGPCRGPQPWPARRSEEPCPF